jgi:polar amino acid transport system substrate-binding protein
LSYHLKTNFRTTIGCIAVVAAAVALTACGSSNGTSSGPASDGKTLIIGLSADNPPMESKDVDDPSKLTGFDIDMISSVFGKLNIKYKIQQIDFNGLIPALQAGHLDLIISDLWVNADRSKAVDFVSYMKAAQSVMVRAGNPLGIMSMDGLCGHRAAAKLGSVGQTALQDQSGKCTAAGKKAIDVQTYTTFPAEADALNSGRIDATLEDALATGVYAKANTSSVSVAFVQDSGIIVAAGLKKGDSALASKLETGFKDFQSSGAFASTANKYGVPMELQLLPSVITNFTG